MRLFAVRNAYVGDLWCDKDCRTPALFNTEADARRYASEGRRDFFTNTNKELDPLECQVVELFPFPVDNPGIEWLKEVT